jgi:hypothetical protein
VPLTFADLQHLQKTAFLGSSSAFSMSTTFSTSEHTQIDIRITVNPRSCQLLMQRKDSRERTAASESQHLPFLMAGLMGAPSALTTTLNLRVVAGFMAAAWHRARRVDIESAMAVC